MSPSSNSLPMWSNHFLGTVALSKARRSQQRTRQAGHRRCEPLPAGEGIQASRSRSSDHEGLSLKTVDLGGENEEDWRYLVDVIF